MKSKSSVLSSNPEALVAVAYGSHKQGNKRLKKLAVTELQERFGIRLSFMKDSRELVTQ